MGVESAKKASDGIFRKATPQKNQLSLKQDRGCRYKLASKYIDHMPHVQDSSSRFAAWSDVKEVLFPSCSDPDCDIVLNALKIVSRYPWEESKMQPCTPKQQMKFLRNFRLVPSGTLLVDLQFVKDNIDGLWEMVWLKHGTSLDVCSRRCHYAKSQLSRAENVPSSYDKEPPDKHNETKECNTDKSDCKEKETNSEASHPTETDPDTTRVDDDVDADVNKSEFVKKSNLHQLDNNFLPGKSQPLTEEKTDKKKVFTGYRYPTIETLKVIPRKVQPFINTCINSKQMGYIVLPVVKSSNTDSDEEAFCSGAEISATFPQLHDYLDRLSSEYIAGHIDSSNKTVRRCTCIEGRCFTNWKITRHGWNLPWQHVTSKDIVVSWGSVVKELQCLAGKAVADVSDILPVSTSGLINFKDHFSHQRDDEDYISSANLMSSKDYPKQEGQSNLGEYFSQITEMIQKPEQMKHPLTLYNLCQAKLEVCSIPRACSMEGKTVLPPVNSHVQSVVKGRGNPYVATTKKKDTAQHDMKQSTRAKGGRNNVHIAVANKKEKVNDPVRDDRLSSLRKRTGTRSASRNAYTGLHAMGENDASTSNTKNISKPKNVDKTTQPRKRQRMKSPTESTKHAVNTTDIYLNRNKNALDNNVTDGDIDGPTLLQLLSQPIGRSNSSTVCGNSTNQNALCRNISETPPTSNVFIRHMSQPSQQQANRSKLFQYPTSRITNSLERAACLTGSSSTHDETFHHLRTPFPRKTFEKYSGVWNRISATSNDQFVGEFQNTKPEPIRSCEKVTTATSKCSTKSKPQWDIDQIIKEHPRRIKGDSLYGISINKTQARNASHQPQTTPGKSDTKTLRSKPGPDGLQSQTNNEVLPKVVRPVKPRDFLLPPPSGKPSEEHQSQKKEMWFRHESVSHPKVNIHAGNLLEMVSANPFNQTVESMIALRKFNCEFDVLRGGISNGTIGQRSSPLPKIDAGRGAATHPVRSDNSLCYQRSYNLVSHNNSTTAKESEKTESSLLTKNHNEKKNTKKKFPSVHSEKDIKASTIHKDKKEHKNHCSKYLTSKDDIKKSPQKKNKDANEVNPEPMSDELPKQSKSENCLQSKNFRKINNSVCKSASSPGLRSNRYKVELNDLTLRFVRLKDDKKDPKGDKNGHKLKPTIQESVSESTRNGRDCPSETMRENSEVTRRNGTTTSLEQATTNLRRSPLFEEKEKYKRDRTESSNQSQTKDEVSGYSKNSDVDEIAKTMESKIDVFRTPAILDNEVYNFSKLHIHNKKRWLMEYKQNNCNTLNSETDDSSPKLSESLDVTDLVHSVSDEPPLGNSVSRSEFQPANVLLVPQGGSVDDGNEIKMMIDERNDVCKPPSEGENDVMFDFADVACSTSRDTTYSENTDYSIPTSSDGILLVDDNELGLVEEVVGGVESFSVTDVTDLEENTKRGNNQQIQPDLNIQTKHTETKDSSVQSDTDDPFEGSVYVFDDSKKSGSRKGSSSGVQIIRRSVRQHLSPRKSMAEVSDKSIYSSSERKPPTSTKRRKGKKSVKTKTVSMQQTGASKENSPEDLTYTKDIENPSETSVNKSTKSTRITNTIITDTDKFSEHTPGKSWEHTPGKSLEHTLGKFSEHTSGKFSEHTTGKSWEYTPGKSWEHTPGKSSEHTSGKSWEHTPGKSWEDTPGKFSEHIPGKSSEHTPGKSRTDTKEIIGMIATGSNPNKKKSFSDVEKTYIEPPSHCTVKERNITKKDMSSASSAIQHLAAEQRRMMVIIKQSSSSRSLPSPASYPTQGVKSNVDTSSMGSSTFSFVPVYMKDQACKGGYAHMEGVTCPYVIMDGYKFVAIHDVLRMFPNCDKTCKVVKRVLVKHGGLSHTFCDWDQVYLLDQLFILKGRSVKTGDMLIRVDSLVKNLQSIRDRVGEEHLNLRRKGKTDLQCVRDLD
ncbi:uncharacterized protein LOC117316871 [Pecten maximus]|uniref:uncharacterized protein LOC117316871 n=1 Tax=Pecten maximus TaxID=6579 RepID=UPI0014581D5E|nr:uncharacterized protein LOC117316871 [Pecten maximus]